MQGKRLKSRKKLAFGDDGMYKFDNGQMTGTEFFMRYCDGKLWDDDIREDVLPFVNEYFNGAYLNDYCSCCIDETEKPLYEVISDKADYEKLREKIDTAYRTFLLK